jgi:hypothetical protein
MERPRRGKSEAELIDERELNSALEALCRWIRQDDSLLLGEPDRLRRKQQQQKQMRQQRPRLPGDATTTRFSARPSRMVATATTAATAAGSSSNRNRDERRPPKSQRNSQRTSRNTALGAYSDGYQAPNGHAQLKDLEQRIPIDELCKWLSESSGCQFGNSRQEAIPRRTGSSTDGSGGVGRHTQQQKQDEEDTPSTFHLHSGGSSSLIVLGAMGNIIKAPKGRSPLRKNFR